MKRITSTAFLTILTICAGGALAEAKSSRAMPPIKTNPECKWSKAARGEWLCKGRFKLNPGEGDLQRQGHCGTQFTGIGMSLTSLNIEIASPLDAYNPIYLVGLSLNREVANNIIVAGTFLSEKTRPENVYCNFSARIRLR